jgi:hypothetical protein
MLGETISAEKYDVLVRSARAPGKPWLDLGTSADFAAAYNRRPFFVHHRLPEHPLFQLDALLRLCRRLPANQVKYRFGVVPVDTDFDKSLDGFREGLTRDEAIEQLEQRQAYIVINNPERDGEYQPAIEQLLGEIAAQTRSLDPWINWYSTYVFISAQGSVTPYHMDREMNFLLQVRGTKTARLWDPFDEQVMSSAQKDVLLTDRDAPRPTYSPLLDAKAMVFALAPGRGVHHPFIAPHLVTTGPQLSISLAITFRTECSDIWTDAHAFNYQARKLGLHPGPVRRSLTIDRTKAALLRGLRQSRAVWRGVAKPASSGTG